METNKLGFNGPDKPVKLMSINRGFK